MKTDDEIRSVQNRMITALSKCLEPGQSTSNAHAEIGDGLTCTFFQGDQSAVMDMPETMGGAGSAPTPGFFGRAGVSGCLAIGIKMCAIREGLEFRRVRIDIETDFDDGAIFGLGDKSAAPLETRLVINIDTDEPEARVKELVDRVMEMDPWFLALRDAQNVKTSLSVAD